MKLAETGAKSRGVPVATAGLGTGEPEGTGLTGTGELAVEEMLGFEAGRAPGEHEARASPATTTNTRSSLNLPIPEPWR
jgi:hypothetical protein